MSTRAAQVLPPAPEEPALRFRSISEYGPEDWAREARRAEEAKAYAAQHAEEIAWYNAEIARRGLWNGKPDDE